MGRQQQEYAERIMSEPKNKIEVPEGTDGQQPQWPGDGHAPESGTDSTEKTDSRPEGTRKPERIHIPIVR